MLNFASANKNNNTIDPAYPTPGILGGLRRMRSSRQILGPLTLRGRITRCVTRVLRWWLWASDQGRQARLERLGRATTSYRQADQLPLLFLVSLIAEVFWVKSFGVKLERLAIRGRTARLVTLVLCSYYNDKLSPTTRITL